MAAQSEDAARDRRPRGVSRVWLLLLAGVAAGLGYWGFWIYRPRGAGEQWWDLIYYDLQLFGLEFNDVPGQAVPPQLQLARILAPAATFIAAFFAIVGASSLWRRLARWHFAIVVGDTAEARAVAKAIRNRSVRAVAERAIGLGGVIEVVKGDLASLRAAGVTRARAVYAFGDDRQDVAANVATALAAVSARRRRGSRANRAHRGPQVFVHVTDPDLAIGLRARRFMAESNDPSNARVEFFSMDEVAARVHVQHEAFDAGVAQPHVVVAGGGVFGQAVIVALAQHWRDTSGRAATTRLKVSLVDQHAADVVAKLRDRWLPVERFCDLAAVDAEDLRDVLHRPELASPHRTYICYEDEDVALSCALDTAPLWNGGPGSLVIRLSRLAQLAQVFAANSLLDNVGDRLTVAEVAELAAPVVAGAEGWDIYWELAPAIHARYLALTAGAGAGATQRLWEALERDFKESNYDQARHLATKLREIGATVAPRSARNEPFVLTDVDAADVERLAPDEHERWMRDRRAHGWRYAAARDDRKKLHPSMRSWVKLSDIDQDKDRDTIRAIPHVYADALADFGLQIIRRRS